MSRPDPYGYVPPDDITRPRFAAIRAACDQALRELSDRPQFDDIGRIVRSLDSVITSVCPPSADLSAAWRNLALARNIACEMVPDSDTPTRHAELYAQLRSHIDDARRNACSAVTHAKPGALPKWVMPDGTEQADTRAQE